MKNIKYNLWFGKGKDKLVAWLVIIAMFLIISISIVISIGYSLKSVLNGDKGALYYALRTGPGVAFVIVFEFFIVLMFLILIFRKSKRNIADVKPDEHGVRHMQDGTYGTSHFEEDEEEIRKRFYVDDVKNINTTIFGKLTPDVSKTVAWKRPPKNQASGNLNNLILATSGSGKSFTFVRTELLQVIKSGSQSFVVNDPSGELYTDLAQICINKGMEVKVLNTADLYHSDFWDCLEETIDPTTGRLNVETFTNFTRIYMMNCVTEKKNFFEDNAWNLANAVLGYTAFKHEDYILQNLKKLYLKILGGNQNGEEYRVFNQRTMNEYISLKWCEELIRNAAEKNNYDLEEVNRVIDKIIDVADYKYPYTLKQFFRNLRNIDDIEEEINKIPEYHPARVYVESYKANTQTKGSAKQGALLAFSNLASESVVEVLSHKGIHLSDVNKKRCAYFVISGDNYAVKPVLTIFFTYLFSDIGKTHDMEERKAQLTNGKNPCIPVSVILDEFPSLGIIGVSQTSFPDVMAQARKREIRISIIIQNYTQIESIYNKDNRDTILANCETTIYLGGNDIETIKYISQFVGPTTVLDISYDEAESLMAAESGTNRIKAASRDLITSGEARVFGKDGRIMVIRHKCEPLILYPFAWIDHPLYIKTKRCVENDIVDLRNRIKVNEKPDSQASRDYEVELTNNIENLAQKEIKDVPDVEFDLNTGEVIQDTKPKRRILDEDDKPAETEPKDNILNRNKGKKGLYRDDIPMINNTKTKRQNLTKSRGGD